jgi:hypothetical protein
MNSHLRNFQLSLGRYLRDPGTQPLPEGIEPRRALVYEELLFTNVRGFINSCFPVCKSLTGDGQWQSLIRRFFREWRAASPYFYDIPKEFLAYLRTGDALADFPEWYYELAHYEWIELHVETLPVGCCNFGPSRICTNPTLVNHSFEWPVHKISPEFIPPNREPTFLAVFRNVRDEVTFMQLNAATSVLVELVKPEPMSVDGLAKAMAAHLRSRLDDNVKRHIQNIVAELTDGGLFVGSADQGC